MIYVCVVFDKCIGNVAIIWEDSRNVIPIALFPTLDCLHALIAFHNEGIFLASLFK